MPKWDQVGSDISLFRFPWWKLPSDFVFQAWSRLDCLLRKVEEDHEALDHPDRLVERTISIVSRKSILLQKIVFDEFCDFQSDLVAFGQGCFANQLNDFCKIFFFLKKERNLLKSELLSTVFNKMFLSFLDCLLNLLLGIRNPKVQFVVQF